MALGEEEVVSGLFSLVGEKEEPKESCYDGPLAKLPVDETC